jgi:hypothetical protein
VSVLYDFALCNAENGAEHFKMQNSVVKATPSVFWELEAFGQQEDESRPPLSWQRQTVQQFVHREGNCNNGVELAPSSSPQGPDLAPSDIHQLGPLKDALRGRGCADDNLELKRNVLMCSDASTKSFTASSQRFWGEGRKYVMKIEQTLWQINLNFVKDLHVICIIFL